MIYRSLRIGKNGQPFYLYKLKTMKEHGGIATASFNDPRLTKTGKWLRKWKLDELPTLWNILKGDIVLVGPRPDTPEEFADLSENTRNLMYSVKPGIISPATIWNYKEDQVLADKKNPYEYYTRIIKPVKYYLNEWYIQNKSFWLDTRIFLAYVFRHFGISPRFFNIFPPNFGIK